jgi:predicted  nucleic acid-binding Zn-ribbon protein
MNHAERVKAEVQQFAESIVESAKSSVQFGAGRLGDVADAQFRCNTAIDAMQSALDAAVADRDKYMGLWAALSQDEGKADRAIAELEAKLAERDAEMERLRVFADRVRAVLEKGDKQVDAAVAALSEEVKGGN